MFIRENKIFIIAMTDKLDKLGHYANSIKRLKHQALSAGLTEEEFKKLYMETLHSIDLEHNASLRTTNIFRYGLIIANIIALSVFAWYIYTHQNDIQQFIYIILKFTRGLSLPIISLFPSLTEYYYETCLIQNPYFTVVDMECWPCSNVKQVIEVDTLDGTENLTSPFFYKTDQRVIDVEALEELYKKHKKYFDSELPRISQVKAEIKIKPLQMFDTIKRGAQVEDTFVWKILSMNAARIIRQVIPRPQVVPKYGQSLERFIIVYLDKQTIKLPDTECPNAFILALSGEAEVQLNPAQECRHQCTTVNVRLKETYLLRYNWWYWKPSVQHTKGNKSFIAQVGSYC